jgi:tRNA A37 threonylcarbamoyladenosine modification protein TsaB
MPKSVDLVFITLSSPIKIGVYKENKLIDSIVSEEKSSDILPKIYSELSNKYDIKKLFYANGPGSFMAIKVAYIFLKSMSILKNIPLFATDAFYFNENQPIKAIGKLFFVKISSEIKTQKLEIAPEVSFRLPDVLDYSEFSTTVAPVYGIGAVGS